MSAKVLQARFSRLQNAIVVGNWESAWLDSNVMCILTDGNNNDHHDAKNLLTRHSCSLKNCVDRKKKSNTSKVGRTVVSRVTSPTSIVDGSWKNSPEQAQKARAGTSDSAQTWRSCLTPCGGRVRSVPRWVRVSWLFTSGAVPFLRIPLLNSASLDRSGRRRQSFQACEIDNDNLRLVSRNCGIGAGEDAFSNNKPSHL